MARQRWLEVPGCRVHGVAWGRRTRRPTLLLLHGLGGNTVTWESVGAGLARALGTQVVALDLPGFGRTRRGERRATIGANAALVAEVVDQLGPCVVVGNSMGGLVGIRAAAGHPAAVQGLVLVNSPWPRRGADGWRRVDGDALRSLVRFAAVAVPGVGERVFAGYQRRLGPEGSVDVPVAFLFRDPATLDPALRARLVEVAGERFGWGEEASAAYVEATRSLWRYLFDPRALWADVAAVACPTLVVHGTADRLVPAHVLGPVRSRRPDWSYAELQDVGHVPQMEQPGAFHDAVTAWVDGRWPAGSPAGSAR